jgi:NitT/TauT family transport system substrate-binding protein
MIIGKDRPRDSADERDELVPIQLIELHRGIAWRPLECRITDHEFGSLECPGDFHRRTEMIKLSLRFGIPALVLLVDLNCAAIAQDKLRIAGGLAGTWENSFSELGQNAGFFKKRGLVLEIFYTQGAGETQQAVISSSADIGTGVGTFNTFGAFAKGAPIRVIAATHTGANDLTWYVKADSPIKDKKDLAGKSVAYSTAGSSTYAAVQAFQKVFGVTYTPVATGSPASTLTQVMSGQIDVGWTSPPFAVDLLRDGKIRQIMRASDVPELRNQTARFMTANAHAIESRRAVFVRYLQAYREVVDWMYADKAAVKAFADWARVPEAIARLAPQDYYPKNNVLPDRIEGLDLAMADAVSFKYIAAPLSKEQLATLILVPFK